MKIVKILVWLVPVIILLIFHFFGGEKSFTADFNQLLKALTEWGPGLALNALLVGLMLIILLLCGMRIYGFLAMHLKVSPEEDILTGLLIYFILGSLFTFLLLMTVGVMGFYQPLVVAALTLLLLFFPYQLKAFLNQLKNFVKNIKFTFNLEFHLFLSALVFLGIPLLLLQLTSIVPPWMDILEVYVAPVQRVLNFNQYLPHDSLPFSFYNSSRSVPLFTAIYSYIASLTGLQSYAAITGSFIYLLFFSLLAVFFAANSIAASPCGGIAVWLFGISFNFLNFHHGRSGGMIAIFLAPAIAFIVRMVMAETHKEKLQYAILTGLAMGGITLLHPVIGVYSSLLLLFVTLILMIWLSPRYLYWCSFALVGSCLLSATLIFPTRDLTHFSLLQSLLFWFGLLAILGIGLKIIHGFFKKQLTEKITPATSGIKIWVPVAILVGILLLVTLLPWRYMWIGETPVHFLFFRFPIPLVLIFAGSLRLIFLYIKNRTSFSHRAKLGTAMLLISGSFLFQALPLYLLPFFSLESSVATSLCAELPTKAYYWISPLLIIFATLLFYEIKDNITRYTSVFLLQALATIPLLTFPDLGFCKEAGTSLQSVANEQLEFAAKGYFQGWDGDARIPLSPDNFRLIAYLKQLITDKRLHIDDTIYHIAQEQHPWVATPFPAFSGVRQSLLLVKRDPNDINTKWGRISDFPADFDFSVSKEWVLVEKNVAARYQEFFSLFRQKYHLEFENNQVMLFQLNQKS